MFQLFKDRARALLSALAPTGGEERSGFEFVWVILLFTGGAIVVTLLIRILFLDVT
ncbi:hypothetical protein [Limimaricola sp.]|uniref:hypothetical protein n=1 Tax=Limimaricola sp. TaxID=2211665 RepID=UPI0040595B21